MKITFIMQVIDTNQTQLSFAKEVENKVNHCESLSNVILYFNLKDDHYRSKRTFIFNY